VLDEIDAKFDFLGQIVLRQGDKKHGDWLKNSEVIGGKLVSVPLCPSEDSTCTALWVIQVTLCLANTAGSSLTGSLICSTQNADRAITSKIRIILRKRYLSKPTASQRQATTSDMGNVNNAVQTAEGTSYSMN
jgi:hypothetical protein